MGFDRCYIQDLAFTSKLTQPSFQQASAAVSAFCRCILSTMAIFAASAMIRVARTSSVAAIPRQTGISASAISRTIAARTAATARNNEWDIVSRRHECATPTPTAFAFYVYRHATN